MSIKIIKFVVVKGPSYVFTRVKIEIKPASSSIPTDEDIIYQRKIRCLFTMAGIGVSQIEIQRTQFLYEARTFRNIYLHICSTEIDRQLQLHAPYKFCYMRVANNVPDN